MISLPVCVRGGYPGTQQQQVGDRNAGGGHRERQNEHAEYQLAQLGLRVRGGGDLRPTADEMEPDERRRGDDDGRRPRENETRSQRSSRYHVTRGARHHVPLVVRRQRTVQLCT